MKIIRAVRAQLQNIPLRHTFSTALGHKNQSQNVRVELDLHSGRRIWGEASSSLAMPEAKPKAMLAEIKRMTRNWTRSTPRFQRIPSRFPTVSGALESVLLLALDQTSLLGQRKNPIETDITLSLWPTNKTMRVATDHYRQGFRRFKVKVSGATLKTDIIRINKLSHHFKNIALWIDANQGYSLEQALEFSILAHTHRWPIKALEQPLHRNDIFGLKALRKISPHPIYADESARSIQDVKLLIRYRAVDGIVVKVAKSGLVESMEMVRLARNHHLKVMISCMTESSQGLTASVLWAIKDGRFDWVDLDSHLLTISRPANQYVVQGPHLKLSSKQF